MLHTKRFEHPFGIKTSEGEGFVCKTTPNFRILGKINIRCMLSGECLSRTLLPSQCKSSLTLDPRKIVGPNPWRVLTKDTSSITGSLFCPIPFGDWRRIQIQVSPASCHTFFCRIAWSMLGGDHERSIQVCAKFLISRNRKRGKMTYCGGFHTGEESWYNTAIILGFLRANR